MSNNNSINAEEFDRIFDEGEEDVLQYFDMDNIRRPGRETRTVAVDLPVRVLEAVEQQSQATGSLKSELHESSIEERVQRVRKNLEAL